MKITDIQIHVCRHKAPAMKNSEMRDGRRSDLEFLVVRMETDEGITGESFGFAGRGAKVAGEIAASAMKPFFLGKDPMYREKHWHDFRMYDRWWNHVPIYSYGPFDVCCWDIAAKKAGQPLYQYLGAYRDKVPIYASSLVLPKPQDYGKQAAKMKKLGFHAYKLHPPGKYDFDLAAYKACRKAVGENFKLMADPVAAYNHEQAMRMGRELEKLNYYWFEEPLYDVDWHGLRELSRALDIPICGTEVLAGSHYSTAECISSHVVDMVRTDVSWKGGVTAVMKTAHLAESFGMQCEIHTAIYHPLELVNLHCCAAIKNCEFFEVLAPIEYFDFGLVESLKPDKQGYVHLPQKPGLGIDLDWDFVRKCTMEVL
jgi:L-alanine-DL-glutamate epimerase-like enolase superfamily enzyme